MSDEIRRIFIKPPDFASVYADGVMFQKGSDDLSRLVFFQRQIEPSEDGALMDKSTEYIKLIFEVRLPEYRLSQLAENVTEILDLGQKAWKMTKGKTKDEKVLHSWYVLNENIERFLYNTDEDEIDSKAVDKMDDQYSDLVGRTKRSKKQTPTETYEEVPTEEEGDSDESNKMS